MYNSYTQSETDTKAKKLLNENQKLNQLIATISTERGIASIAIASGKEHDKQALEKQIAKSDRVIKSTNSSLSSKLEPLLANLNTIRQNFRTERINFRAMFHDNYSDQVVTPLFEKKIENLKIDLNADSESIKNTLLDISNDIFYISLQRDYLSYFITKKIALNDMERSFLNKIQTNSNRFQTQYIKDSILKEEIEVYINQPKVKTDLNNISSLYLQVQKNLQDGAFTISTEKWFQSNNNKLKQLYTIESKIERQLNQKIQSAIEREYIIFGSAIFLSLLALVLTIIGTMTRNELRNNMKDLEEILNNAVQESDNGFEGSSITSVKDINLHSSKGMQEAYKFIELLIENAKADKREALEANESKSLFLANMSHEIRTPLNGIVGFTELLKSTKLNSEQKEFTNIIEKSSENLLSIINNILDLSKIESNKTELEMVVFDPIVEFENAVETYGVRASEKNIELNFFLDPSINKKLLGDSVKIKEVIINLLSNAIKFTDLGGKISVEIKKVSSIENQTELSFSIQDNGVGMTKEQQLNVFNAFTQADVSITRKYGGTGLGLTISTKFLELMGSKLELESQKEKGTRFYFNITFEEVLESTELGLNPPFQEISICKFNYDVPIQQDIYLAQYLDYYHIETQLFRTPANLKECNENKKIKSIWIDVDDCNEELLNTIHKLHSNKVILLTSFSNRDKLESLNLHGTKVLYKPLTPTKVIQGLTSISIEEEEQEEELRATEQEFPFQDIQFQGNILVAEDNFINQKLIKQILLRYGVKVELANNGLEAFEKRKSENYDLILMDIQMPVMDGVEATHEIINYEIEEELKHTPIIALTANALNGDRERFISEGLDEYIPKPIETNELLFILKKFLKVKGGIDEATIDTPENNKNLTKGGDSLSSNGLMLLLDDEESESLINITDITEEKIKEEIAEKKIILIAKKNPLEAQILSKVISNMGYEIEIVEYIEELENYISKPQYDILLIDRELEEFNHETLEKQHQNMNVIMLTLNQPNNDYYNNKLIKEVQIGIIKRERIEQLIQKYRG
jgi:signal transduction histidine kinase/CheY-like chemotaxis protein